MQSQPTPPGDGAGRASLPADSDDFLAGAGRRMYRGMWILGIAGAAACWFWYGWRWAGGFAVGAMLSALNFHSLDRVVASIGNMVSAPQGQGSAGPRPKAPGPAGSAVRMVLRYALIAVAGYAIFVSSFVSLTAFFIGLFLFVGAVLVEAAYEVYCSFRSA